MSIAAIDPRCFLPPPPQRRPDPGAVGEARPPAAAERRASVRPAEVTPAHLHSLIRRHFGLEAA